MAFPPLIAYHLPMYDAGSHVIPYLSCLKIPQFNEGSGDRPGPFGPHGTRVEDRRPLPCAAERPFGEV